MRIAYCTNVRLPSERAHGHQISHVCDALAALGHRVEIFAPYRMNTVNEDYWTYYRANSEIEVHYIGKTDFIHSPLAPGVLGLWLTNSVLRRELPSLLRDESFDLAYTRAPALLPALIESSVPTILELHQLPNRNRRMFVNLCNQCVAVACLASPIRNALAEWGVDASRLIVAGDAVDLRRFRNLPPKEKAEKKLFFNTNRSVIGYVGRLKTLGKEKGVGILLQALAELKDSKKFFGLIVGGPETDRIEYEKMAKKLNLTEDDIRFAGEVPSASVPIALAACDVLVMPFPDMPHYRMNMSPLKMFEYMAVNRPIITSDLPTIRDVLTEETAVFCKPGNSSSLAAVIDWVSRNPQEAASRAQRAYELVLSHTWEQRMHRILDAAAR